MAKKQTVLLYHSTTAENGVAKKPLASSLQNGELALNHLAADPTMFIKDTAGSIVEFKSKAYIDSKIGDISGGANLPTDYNTLKKIADKLDTFFSSAADQDAVINRWKEVESFLSGIGESENLVSILNTKANKSDVTSSLALKLDKSDVTDTAVASKVVRRNASGQIAGDITGNSATSTTASNALKLGGQAISYFASLSALTALGTSTTNSLALKLDAAEAVTTATANKVVKRDASGKIAGDILGTSADSSKLGGQLPAYYATKSALDSLSTSTNAAIALKLDTSEVSTEATANKVVRRDASGAIKGNILGNAATATSASKLTTARDIKITIAGQAKTVSFNGSANVDFGVVNLANLFAGTDITMDSYNGSVARTISVNSAVAANPNTIVKRDSSGNINASTFNGFLNGVAEVSIGLESFFDSELTSANDMFGFYGEYYFDSAITNTPPNNDKYFKLSTTKPVETSAAGEFITEQTYTGLVSGTIYKRMGKRTGNEPAVWLDWVLILSEKSTIDGGTF